MTKLTLIAAAALAPIATTNAFAPVSSVVAPTRPAFVSQQPLFAEVEDASEAAFVPLEEDTIDDDVSFEVVESLGKGSAKVSFFLFCEKNVTKDWISF